MFTLFAVSLECPPTTGTVYEMTKVVLLLLLGVVVDIHCTTLPAESHATKEVQGAGEETKVKKVR